MSRLAALGRALAVLAVLAGLGAGVLVSVPIRADLSVLLPERADGELATLQRALKEGTANRTIMIGVAPERAFDRESARFEALAAISRALERELEGSAAFARVLNGSLALETEALAPFKAYRYRLNPPLDPASFDQAGLARAFDRLLTELSGLGGLAVEALMAEDPTLRTLEVARHWKPADGPRRENGVWVGRDGQRAVLLARTGRAAFDAEDQARALRDVRAAIDRVAADRGALRSTISGPSVIAVESRNRAEAESKRLLLWSLPVVALILLAAFRRGSVLVAGAVPLAAGFVAGTAAVAAQFGEILAPTLGFGAILVGVGVDYPLHLFAHRTPERTAWQTARGIWGVLALGAVTTAIGFLPLVASSFPGVAQLGVFTLAGLLCAAAATRLALPWVAAPLALPPAGPAWDGLGRLHAHLGRARPVAAVVALAAVTLLAVRGEAVWQDDLREISPIPEATRQADQGLRTDLAATSPRYLVVLRGADAQQILRRSEALRPTLDRLIADGALDGADFAARYLPSAETQAKRLAALPDRAALAASVEAARRGTPFEPGTFDPFVDALAAAKAAGPVLPGEIDSPVLRARLDSLLAEGADGPVGFVYLEGLRAPSALAAAIDGAQVDGVELLDLKAETEALLQGYRDQTLRWIAVGAVLGLAALALGLRGARPVGQVAGAVAAAVLTTAGLLALAGVPFTLFHLMGLMVVAGLGLDYAVFLRDAAQRERAAGDRAAGRGGRRSVAICALTSFAVFGILSGAEIPMLGQLGQVVALGAPLSLLAGAILTAPARTPTPARS